MSLSKKYSLNIFWILGSQVELIIRMVTIEKKSSEIFL
jgi:hypothetical protein